MKLEILRGGSDLIDLKLDNNSPTSSVVFRNGFLSLQGLCVRFSNVCEERFEPGSS